MGESVEEPGAKAHLVGVRARDWAWVWVRVWVGVGVRVWVGLGLESGLR